MRLLHCGLGLVVLLGMGVAFGLNGGAARGDELDAAIAEADRLDPGWTHEGLVTARRASRMADAANGVLQAERALGLLPAGAMAVAGGDADRPLTADERPRGRRLINNLRRFRPEQKLTAAFAEGLKAEVAGLEPSLVEARKLAGFPEGQTGYEPGLNPFATLLPFTQESRRLTWALQLDATARAEAGDIDGALESVRAMVCLARSLGDEPTLISQLVRLAVDEVAVQTLRRVLAQGVASDEALAAVQAILLAEAEAPRLVAGLRGERAMAFDVIVKLADGRLTPMEVFGAMNLEDPEQLTQAIPAGAAGQAFYRHNAAVALRLMTRGVEIAKTPLETQNQAWDRWGSELGAYKDGARGKVQDNWLVLILLPGLESASRAEQRVVATLRAGALAVAAERFRLASGRWPSREEDLVPKLLPAWPVDPYTGKLLKMAKDGENLVVYALGEDREDNQGRLTYRGLVPVGSDVGVRLIAPGARGVPTTELPPMPCDGLEEPAATAGGE